MNELILLALTAFSIGLLHTLVGPDHYVPFIVMSKAREWSVRKTLFVTLLCGIGHVLSSVVLGFLGILLGIAVFHLEGIESMRGDVAAWLLLGFGFTYFVWGIHHALRNKTHSHLHVHGVDVGHTHMHAHTNEHSHVHQEKQRQNLTPWVLFTIFVFGPCEPLIPILMYPAAQGSLISVALVTAVFALATIGTMLSVVFVSSFSLSKVHFGRIERYSHALAGLTLFLCGSAIKFLGL